MLHSCPQPVPFQATYLTCYIFVFCFHMSAYRPGTVQGYLAHKKLQPPRTLQEDCALGPMVALGGGAVSYERGTPVPGQHPPALKIHPREQAGKPYSLNPKTLNPKTLNRQTLKPKP